MKPKEEIATFQSVFKVERKSQDDDGTACETARPFFPRKSHKKSHGGCQACKSRRIKCDEAKPRCSKCRRANVDCHYSSASSPSILSDARAPLPPTSTMHSMALDLVETNMATLFAVPFKHQRPPLGNAHINVECLQHFQDIASLTLGSSPVTRIMHQFVPQMAWSSPYLMHMILAISYAHQKRMTFDAWTRRVFECSEIQSWSHALKLYRSRLSQSQLGPDDGEALIATTVLAICYTFALDDELPADLLTGCDEGALTRVLSPLAATGGFRVLFFILGSGNPAEQWNLVFRTTNDERQTFTSERTGVSGLPRAFVELCNLDHDSTPDNNPYHRLLRLLTPLLHLAPSLENFHILFAYWGRTWEDYKPLLMRKDPRALLLTAYWLALLRQVDQWWLTTRAKSQSYAIVNYLSSLQDPSIASLLSFPAAFDHPNPAYMWDILGDIICDTC